MLVSCVDGSHSRYVRRVIQHILHQEDLEHLATDS